MTIYIYLIIYLLTNYTTNNTSLYIEINMSYKSYVQVGSKETYLKFILLIIMVMSKVYI